MTNEHEVMKLLKELAGDLERRALVTDKTGVSTVERLCWVMDLDPMQPTLKFGAVKQTNEAYVAKELDWYLSQDLNVYPKMSDVKIWTQVCSALGLINSNYGWCIFSVDNGSQYDHVLAELKAKPFSRRAEMIYTRPSMWTDCCENGRSDFICTDKTQAFIRDGRLDYHVHQRSCDLIYGFFNDQAWHHWVYQKLLKDLREDYPDLQPGRMRYIIDSVHVYERHFDLLTQMSMVNL
jgi:thymidylate synthase